MKNILVLGQPTEDFLQSLRASHCGANIRTLTGAEFSTSRDVFLSEIFQWVLDVKPLVVTYSSGWQGSTELLSDVFAHLTGRSPESVQYFLFDMGVEVKSISFTKGFLSIKDVMTSIDQTQLSEPQRLRFQILGELIR